ncbi:MAG: RimJ/RimL family protein N-acetyltransferase [Candidatus Promineifilaceae bacterium]|jgi:RimJ/RimL family protein N-acetyltransferase
MIKFPINPVSISNHKTGETYLLIRADELPLTQKNQLAVADVCNEPAVYDLFKQRLDGKSYTPEMAYDFFQWCRTGWLENSYFVFFITTQEGQPVACVDIKSNSLINDEIGYWCSSSHTGLMTNTVTGLLCLAQNAGFKQLFARVKKLNDKSRGVLVRNRFVFDKEDSEQDRIFNHYKKA